MELKKGESMMYEEKSWQLRLECAEVFCRTVATNAVHIGEDRADLCEACTDWAEAKAGADGVPIAIHPLVERVDQLCGWFDCGKKAAERIAIKDRKGGSYCVEHSRMISAVLDGTKEPYAVAPMPPARERPDVVDDLLPPPCSNTLCGQPGVFVMEVQSDTRLRLCNVCLIAMEVRLKKRVRRESFEACDA